MSRLILLNGPPGSGKSTLARRYVQDHPFALNLDIDVVRGLIGGWAADPELAGRLARAIALAAAHAHLQAGHDVMVAQYLGRPEFIGQLAALAGSCRADFREVVLMDSRRASVARFLNRAASGQDGVPVESADVVGEMYDRLIATLADRPGAVLVDTREGEVDQAYRRLLAALE